MRLFNFIHDLAVLELLLHHAQIDPILLLVIQLHVGTARRHQQVNTTTTTTACVVVVVVVVGAIVEHLDELKEGHVGKVDMIRRAQNARAEHVGVAARRTNHGHLAHVAYELRVELVARQAADHRDHLELDVVPHHQIFDN